MSDEQMWRVANHMRESAERAERAAQQMENAAQRIAFLLEDGYGGNGLRLIELLEKQDVTIQTNVPD